MKESTLFKFSLAISLIGILALLIIVERTEIPTTDIFSIENTEEEDIVKIKGTIERIKETPGLFILKVNDNTESIDVIVFKEDELNFTRGNLIEVEGTIQLYQNKKEIIAKRIIE